MPNFLNNPTPKRFLNDPRYPALEDARGLNTPGTVNFGGGKGAGGVLGRLPPGSTPGVGVGMPGQGQTVTFPGQGGGFNPFGRRIDPGTFGTFPGGGGVNPGVPPQPLNPPYNSNPQPQPGGTPFGERPGPIGMPNPAGDLAAQYPNLATTNAGVSRNIASELSGQLSPETENALWDSANRFGVSSGMPGAGLWSNKFLGNIAGAVEARKAQGIQHYNQTIPTISGTQTVRPETQISLAEQNSINAAAPDPAAQNSYSQWLFDQYLNKVNPAGGSGMYANPGGASRSGGIPYQPPPTVQAAPAAPPLRRRTWQDEPWQGDNAFMSQVNWGPQRYWK